MTKSPWIMRSCSVALLWLLAAAEGSAQIVFVRFKSASIERRYKKHLSVFKGQVGVVGEPKLGIQCDPRVVTFTSGSEAKNEIYVCDPADPSFVPYRWEDGERVKNGKRSVVQFAGDDIQGIGYVDRLQTLAGLAGEYELRVREQERLEELRDAHKKGTREWFGAHGQLLTHLDRLLTWLDSMGYTAAARSLGRSIDKERKVVASESVAERERAALGSNETVKTPERLVEVSEELTEGEAKFQVQQSQHIRITCLTSVSAERITSLLKLGEQIIEGFRREFVDPYRGEDYEDWIPDERFVEFYFGPEDVESYEGFLTGYYGAHGFTGPHRERNLTMGGCWRQRSTPGEPPGLNYWKLREDQDLEATIAHGLGHVLMQYHFNRGRMNDRHPWLQEALAYYLSFSYLGRNSVTCFAWSEPTYARAAVKEGEKTIERGLRGHFNELALAKGPAIDALGRKTLSEIEDADFAKAWSFFDWVARSQGKRGQVWLRETLLSAAKGPKASMERWREVTEQAFEVTDGDQDVFRLLDEKWRHYAEHEQLLKE